MSRSLNWPREIKTACEEKFVSKQDASESVSSFLTTRSISSVAFLADVFRSSMLM